MALTLSRSICASLRSAACSMLASHLAMARAIMSLSVVDDGTKWRAVVVAVLLAAGMGRVMRGPVAQSNTGKIVPFLVGMEVNFREAIQAAFARQNGKPDFQIERGKTSSR